MSEINDDLIEIENGLCETVDRIIRDDLIGSINEDTNDEEYFELKFRFPDEKTDDELARELTRELMALI